MGQKVSEAVKREEGARLRQAREARGLSQTTLADRAKVDQTAVSKTELGKIHLTDAKAGALADVLGVSVAWIRTGEGTGPTMAEQSHTRRVEAPLAVLNEALDAAFDKARGHRLLDVGAVREAFKNERLPAAASVDEIARAALRILDAAVALRTEGRPVTLGEILLKVAA